MAKSTANSITIGKLTIKEVSQQVAQKIKAAANILANVQTLALPQPEAAQQIKPGKERWPVKTLTDDDNKLIDENIVNGKKLGPGYVSTTVEELINIPRPSDMVPVTQDFAAYQQHRSDPVETTIWQLEADIIAIKMENDGDYHLVLQGESGDTMIGEVPNPSFVNIGKGKCPPDYLVGITNARKQFDDKMKPLLEAMSFVGPVGKNYIPATALTENMAEALPNSARMETAGIPQNAPFKAKIRKKAKITGVGFFDRVHGQTGVAPNNGIELHPIIDIQWIKE